VPLILNSPVFRTQKAALFVTFDEGYGLYPTDNVYTVWAGPVVKTHHQSSFQYSHYSLLKTIEATWDLQPMTAKDEGSPDMREFFPIPLPPPPVPLIVNFTFSPTNPDTGTKVNFSGSATGGTQPYAYNWSFGNGDRGTGQTIGYAYVIVGNHTANLTVTDASGQTATTSRAVSVDADSSSFGTCQGCKEMTVPRNLGLLISFALGIGLPLMTSAIISRKRRTPRQCSKPIQSGRNLDG